MDAVSLETPQENEFIKQRIARGNVRYIWTSGRKCNFAGCDRPDLQPPNINGWFWSGSGAKIGPTTQRNSGDWSNTGGFGQAQPDNREAPQVNYLFSYLPSRVLFKSASTDDPNTVVCLTMLELTDVLCFRVMTNHACQS